MNSGYNTDVSPTPNSVSPPVVGTPAETLRQTSWLRRCRARYVFHKTGSRKRLIGNGHRLNFHDALLHHCTIEISGNRNVVEIMRGARLWDVTIRLVGEDLFCRIGADSRLHAGTFVLEDKGSRLEIGKTCTLYSPMCVVHEGGTILIGDDCMVAYGSDLRNSDGHSILDASTQQRINPAKDITLEEHVWIGAQCQILKGVTIGSRAIVAARSVVTKSVPPSALVAGVPTRVIREGVDWDRRRL